MVIAGGLIGALVLLVHYVRGNSITPEDTRFWLVMLISVEFAVVLLIAG